MGNLIGCHVTNSYHDFQDYYIPAMQFQSDWYIADTFVSQVYNLISVCSHCIYIYCWNSRYAQCTSIEEPADYWLSIYEIGNIIRRGTLTHTLTGNAITSRCYKLSAAVIGNI